MAQIRENIAGQMPDNSGSAGLPWRLFSFILILFLISLFSYVGLQYGYKPFLERQITATTAQIEDFNSRLDLEDRKDLTAFYSQIVNLKSLLNSHIFSSKVFPFLQSSTSTGVAYSTFNLDVPLNQLKLDGVALNYDTLVQQLLFWQNSPSVAKLILLENATVDGLIRFGVVITFIPDFLTTIDSTVGGGQPTTVAPASNPPVAPAPGTSTTTTTTNTQTNP